MKVWSVFIVVMALAMSPTLTGEEVRDSNDIAAQFKDISEQLDALDAKLRSSQLTITETFLAFSSLSELIGERIGERENKIQRYSNTFNEYIRSVVHLSEEEIVREEAELKVLEGNADQAGEELKILRVFEKVLQVMQAREEGCPRCRCADNPDGTLTCDGILYRPADTVSDSPS